MSSTAYSPSFIARTFQTTGSRSSVLPGTTPRVEPHHSCWLQCVSTGGQYAFQSPKLWSYITAALWNEENDEIVTLCLAHSRSTPLDVLLQAPWGTYGPVEMIPVDKIMRKVVEHFQRWPTAELFCFRRFTLAGRSPQTIAGIDTLLHQSHGAQIRGTLGHNISPGCSEAATTRCPVRGLRVYLRASMSLIAKYVNAAQKEHDRPASINPRDVRLQYSVAIDSNRLERYRAPPTPDPHLDASPHLSEH